MSESLTLTDSNDMVVYCPDQDKEVVVEAAEDKDHATWIAHEYAGLSHGCYVIEIFDNSIQSDIHVPNRR